MALGEDSSIGKQIGEYRILSLLGHGAYGSVYCAQHFIFEDDEMVAMKLLRGVIDTEVDRQRFFLEARLHKKLSSHPHILPIRSAGIHEGIPYMVMEYAPGGLLKDRLHRLRGQPLPQDEALTILKQIGDALHSAHQQNVVHRDLKPDNILFNARGEALLADFGIAAILSSGTKDMGHGGTPAYMAPEQFQRLVSAKSDQYALGCIAYELLAGRKPFDVDGVGMEAVWYQHTKVIPPSPKDHNPRLSETVAQAVLTALAKDRTQRYADVPAFLATLATPTNTKTALQWHEEGLALGKQGKHTEALQAFEEAIGLSPRYANAYYNKGYTLDDLGRYEEALRAYDEAIRLKPDEALAYYNKGVALANLGRNEEALRAYDEAIRLKPDDASTHYNKGIALENLRRDEEALRAYDEAIRLQPNYADAYNNKGAALENMGRNEEALRAYEAAIRLKPDFALAYRNKGDALKKLGRSAEAEQAYQKARELGYKG